MDSFGRLESCAARKNLDPFRDDRYRISPLVSWQPTPFSRIRLQYNYDRAKHLRARPDDRTIFYFAGYGLRGADGSETEPQVFEFGG